MSILIKGMEMPKKGEYKPLFIYDTGEVAMEIRGEEVQVATAVPVPPHGRLGDLDELAKRIEHDRYHHTHTDGLAARHHIAEYGHFLNAIAAAPTIIPAEEE